jgi:predicted neuraminidase
VLFVGENEHIYLFYKIGHTIPAWQTMVMASDDRGESWETPQELVEGDRGGRGPVKNKPIRLTNGTWLAPASIESEVWDAFVDISTDRGKSWTKSGFVPIIRSQERPDRAFNSSLPVPEFSFHGKGVIQPTLWESQPGTVHMLLRSTEGRIFRSDSSDNGQSWCPAYPTSLPNNNSGIDLVRLPDGELVLVYNPVGENWGKRTPIVLRTSTDNGKNWGNEYVLEDSEGEYSYPAIVSQGNDVHLTYTWKRERIVFWKVTVGNL